MTSRDDPVTIWLFNKIREVIKIPKSLYIVKQEVLKLMEVRWEDGCLVITENPKENWIAVKEKISGLNVSTNEVDHKREFVCLHWDEDVITAEYLDLYLSNSAKTGIECDFVLVYFMPSSHRALVDFVGAAESTIKAFYDKENESSRMNASFWTIPMAEGHSVKEPNPNFFKSIDIKNKMSDQSNTRISLQVNDESGDELSASRDSRLSTRASNPKTYENTNSEQGKVDTDNSFSYQKGSFFGYRPQKKSQPITNHMSRLLRRFGGEDFLQELLKKQDISATVKINPTSLDIIIHNHDHEEAEIEVEMAMSHIFKRIFLEEKIPLSRSVDRGAIEDKRKELSLLMKSESVYGDEFLKVQGQRFAVEAMRHFVKSFDEKCSSHKYIYDPVTDSVIGFNENHIGSAVIQDMKGDTGTHDKEPSVVNQAQDSLENAEEAVSLDQKLRSETLGKQGGENEPFRHRERANGHKKTKEQAGRDITCPRQFQLVKIPSGTIPKNQESYGMDRLKVILSRSDITKCQADVLVNVLSPNAQLNGDVSQAFLKKAGKDLKKKLKTMDSELREVCLVETPAYNMKTCKCIYHAVLPEPRKGACRENSLIITTLLVQIFNKASSSGYWSIGLPAIGCGALKVDGRIFAECFRESLRTLTAMPGYKLRTVTVCALDEVYDKIAKRLNEEAI